MCHINSFIPPLRYCMQETYKEKFAPADAILIILVGIIEILGKFV